MTISTWQEQLRTIIRDTDELLRQSELAPETVETAKNAQNSFPVKVPRGWLERIGKNNVNDPLLRQVLPLAEEDADIPGYSHDPVSESRQHHSPGLIQKYHGRALLVTTPTCAIHCRYCFRRHYPYHENHAGRDNWQAALDNISTDSSIREIILSGGDPLTLSDDRLQSLLEKLEAIPHLELLRIHSRIPLVLPDRITPALISIIGQNRMRQTIVVHCNHPDEIDDRVAAVLQQLATAGIQLLNQSVLLRGINDDAVVLAELSRRLYQSRVLPYYLHLLDPVQGAAHFDVDEATGITLTRKLREMLPGYLVPRLVREIPGQDAKTIIM